MVWAGDGEGRGCADFRVGGVTARTPHGPTVAIGGLNAPHIPGPGGKRRADPWPCWAPPGASHRPPSPAPLVPGLRQLPGGEGQAGGWGRCGRFFRLRRTLHVLPLPRRFAWGRNPAMAGTPRPGPARHCRPSRTFRGPRGLCHAPSERPTQLAPRLRMVREPASPQVCRRESRWTRPPDHLTVVLGGGQRHSESPAPTAGTSEPDAQQISRPTGHVRRAPPGRGASARTTSCSDDPRGRQDHMCPLLAAHWREEPPSSGAGGTRTAG